MLKTALSVLMSSFLNAYPSFHPNLPLLSTNAAGRGGLCLAGYLNVRTGSITSECLLFGQSSLKALRNVYWKKHTCNKYDVVREKSVDLKRYF